MSRDSNNKNIPATPPGAGCTPFPPNSFLCGAFQGMFPDSPNNTPFNNVQNCGAWAENEGEQNVEAAMESLDDKFRPHLCEDREFYVINHGTISADAESLSLPSFIHGLSVQSESPPRREKAPSFEQDHLVMDDAPYSTMMYPSDDFMQEAFPNESNPSTPTRLKNVHGSKLAPKAKPSPASSSDSNISPTSVKDSHREDSERLKKLIDHYGSDKSVQSTKSNLADQLKGAKAYMPSVVQPCMAPPQPQQPPESMVVYENSEEYEAGKIQSYWKEKFEQAATKVIENSGTRCMEIIDPTIPRASDAQRRIQMEQENIHNDNIKKRRHYRKVLTKYKKHRLLVLILDPSCKLYEVLELPFRPDETTVADVLIMARIQTTDGRLRYQEYVGLCRPQLEPPPPPRTPPRYPGSLSSKTPPRPPRVNRVKGAYYQPRNDDADRDGDHQSLSSESTANTSNNSTQTHHEESTCPEDLVVSLLPQSTPSLPPHMESSTPTFLTLPLLGDIVVTIPHGYSGEEVSKYAQAILQSPMFLRWIQKRYLDDLQRDNDELLSRHEAVRPGAAVSS